MGESSEEQGVVMGTSEDEQVVEDDSVVVTSRQVVVVVFPSTIVAGWESIIGVVSDLPMSRSCCSFNPSGAQKDSVAKTASALMATKDVTKANFEYIFRLNKDRML